MVERIAADLGKEVIAIGAVESPGEGDGLSFVIFAVVGKDSDLGGVQKGAEFIGALVYLRTDFFGGKVLIPQPGKMHQGRNLHPGIL